MWERSEIRDLRLLLHLFLKLGICWYQLEFLDNAVTFSSQSRALLSGHVYVTQTVTGTFPTQLWDIICIRLSGIIGNLTCIDFGLHFTVFFCSVLGSEVSILLLSSLSLIFTLLLAVLLSSDYHWEKKLWLPWHASGWSICLLGCFCEAFEEALKYLIISKFHDCALL